MTTATIPEKHSASAQPKKLNKNTVCIYHHNNVIVLATGLERPSINSKTGDMIQTYIMRADIAPDEAAKMGLDETVCGNCALRPLLVKLYGKTGDVPCYVDKVRGPAGAWHSWNSGRVEYMTASELSDIIADKKTCPGLCLDTCKLDHNHLYKAAYPKNGHARKTCEKLNHCTTPLGIRDGAYGDPAAVPIELWQQLHANGAKRTSYTHQWQTKPELKTMAMASIDSQTFPDVDKAINEAKAMGFRWYRMLKAGETLRPDEIMCPEAPKDSTVQCAPCGLCDGMKFENRKQVGIAIPAITK